MFCPLLDWDVWFPGNELHELLVYFGNNPLSVVSFVIIFLLLWGLYFHFAYSTNTWRLKNTILNNEKVTAAIKREVRKFLERNDNENTTTQNLWEAAKVVLRGRFITIQFYLKKEEKLEIDKITLHLKQLEKEQQQQQQQKNPKLVEAKKS